METELFDVIVTIGHERVSTRDSMLERILMECSASGVPSPNSCLMGRGQWGGEVEFSGALLYTDVPAGLVDEIKTSALVTGYVYQQEAVGVFVVPAGSALVYCKDRDKA